MYYPMNIPRFLKLGAWSVGCVGILFAGLPAAHATDGVTAVYSRVSDDYNRETLPSGSFESESYAFGDGGYYGAAIRDDTIDNLTFRDVAHTIADSLAAKNYVTGTDPNHTRLLIMVYWGATNGSQDFSGLRAAATGGGRRGRGNGSESFEMDSGTGSWALGSGVYGAGSDLQLMTDTHNASILGYMDELNQVGEKARRERSDLLEEVEYSRYFVVLMAYDFQLLWKHKERKLLWESRFSVREQGNDFTVALPAMAKYASDYFGQDSHGLLRTRVPDGRIYMGDPTIIGYLSGR
jgi:hypothetical protein